MSRISRGIFSHNSSEGASDADLLNMRDQLLQYLERMLRNLDELSRCLGGGLSVEDNEKVKVEISCLTATCKTTYQRFSQLCEQLNDLQPLNNFQKEYAAFIESIDEPIASHSPQKI